MSDTAVYALTPQGAALARSLAPALQAEVYLPERMAKAGERAFVSLADCLGLSFRMHGRHVFVAACGIVVRLLCPLLTGKASDPAVAVLDQDGRFCVSLLSGHLGGANALALEVAGLTGGQAVITTATDAAGLPSADMLVSERGLVLADTGAVKTVNAALLEGRSVQVRDPGGWLGELDGEHYRPVTDAQWRDSEPGIWVDWRSTRPAGALAAHPRCLWVGVGCRKGASADEIFTLVGETLHCAGLAPEAVAGWATVEEKRGEAGLLEAAARFGAELRFFGKNDLAAFEVPNPSQAARRYLGVDSVCEAAALAASGGGRLVAEKRKSARATAAAALAPPPAGWWW